MQRAYQNLLNNKTAKDFPAKGSSKSTGNYTITTTHKYYKFTPEDSIQYERLINDSILAVSDVPFEYDIDIEGDKYQASDMVRTNFTHYYSVVPVDYKIPTEVPHTLVANMHFTPEDEIQDDPTELEKEMLDFYHNLNLEAEKVADNLDEEEQEKILYNYVLPDGTYQQLTWQQAALENRSLDDLIIDFSDNEPMLELRGLFRRKWNPSGTIKTQEDAIRGLNIGVWDAHVRVRKWGFYVIKTADTNKDGQFMTSSTRTKKVKYSVYFKNNSKNFVVKAGTVFWDARHRGTRTYKRTSWNQLFTKGTRSHFYSLIHNAARDYYTRSVQWHSIHKPNYSNEKLRLNGKWNGNDSNYFDVPIPILGLFFSEIRIARKNSNGNHKWSDDIYATVTHEMAHASHYKMDSFFFLNIFNPCERKLIRESWAEGVETVVTNHRYNQLTGHNYFSTNGIDLELLRGWNGYRQTETIDGSGGFDEINEYSPLFIDMVDDINQNTLLSLLGNQPVDRVSWYNLYQLQQSLKSARGLHGLKERIKKMHSNSTEKYIDELFNEYAFAYCK